MTIASPWIVIKFGGTSVSTEKNWRHILTIIRGHLAASRRVLVVCSAITHVSNKLEALLTAALVGEHAQLLAELEEIHKQLCVALNVDFAANLAAYFKRLTQLAEGISLIGELTPRIRAQVMAHGELMLTVLAAAFLRTQQLQVDWQDARELLTTETDTLGSPQCDLFNGALQRFAGCQFINEIKHSFITGHHSGIYRQQFRGRNRFAWTWWI